MAGLLEIQNNNRKQALGQMGYLSGLEGNRNANNERMKSQAEAQQKQALGSGAMTLGIGLATSNPIMAGMGAIGILGSLF